MSAGKGPGPSEELFPEKMTSSSCATCYVRGASVIMLRLLCVETVLVPVNLEYEGNTTTHLVLIRESEKADFSVLKVFVRIQSV